MKPNVVYLISDQHRWDFIGYEEGNGVTHTPNLDEMASAGTAFRQAARHRYVLPRALRWHPDVTG
jgi:arylsulfatase A-like enzyme